jgi:antitoxin HicB
MNNPHIGGSLDDFLDEQGLLPEIQASAFKKVIAWMIKEYIADNKLTSKSAAIYFGMSERCLEQVLDENYLDIELKTILFVINKMGKRLKINIV